MPMYEVRAIETREYSVTYHIEADNEEEARKMVEEGDTIGDEVDSNFIGDGDAPTVVEVTPLNEIYEEGGEDNG